MAGDWIKMRGNLWDDPRVAKLCELTEQGEAAVIGALYWLWATADQHTEDGFMPGLTVRQIDRKTGVPGFGQALLTVGWLVDSDGGVTVAKFDDHNGASAKRRCTDAQRKANGRKLSASDADKTQTDDGQVAELLRRIAELEKEKRREEENQCTHTPLALEWALPKAWGDEAMAENPHWTAEVVRSIAAQFADHWRAGGGTSADWAATWRKWCRDDLTQKAHPAPKPKAERHAQPVGITVPCTDTGAEKYKAAMDQRAATSTRPPAAILALAGKAIERTA